MHGSDYQFPRPFRILVADDCEHSRALVEIALTDPMLSVEFRTDGSQALEVCQESLPDLVILDVQMPGATGIEVCQWIKTNCGNNFVPVILLTSQSELTDKVNGLNCGADEYITKPFQLPELFARVRAMLRIKDVTDHLQQTKELLKEKEKLLVAMQVGGAAAHELGQPLTALLLNCQLLARVCAGQPHLGDALSAIQEQCEIMRRTLGKLNSLTDYRTTKYVDDVQILDLRLNKQALV